MENDFGDFWVSWSSACICRSRPKNAHTLLVLFYQGVQSVAACDKIVSVAGCVPAACDDKLERAGGIIASSNDVAAFKVFVSDIDDLVCRLVNPRSIAFEAGIFEQSFPASPFRTRSAISSWPA